MLYLVVGLIVFLGAHCFASLRSRAPGNIKEKMGKSAYMGAFSLVSIIGFALLIYGYGLARMDPDWATPIWIAPEWTRHLILALMPFALILLVAAYAPVGYIRKYSKHPMVSGVKLWALLHLIYNGDWPSILLFGGFLAFGGLSRTMDKIRGNEGARRQDARIIGDVIAVVAGLALYVAFVVYLHEALIGRAVMYS